MVRYLDSWLLCDECGVPSRKCLNQHGIPDTPWADGKEVIKKKNPKLALNPKLIIDEITPVLKLWEEIRKRAFLKREAPSGMRASETVASLSQGLSKSREPNTPQ